MAGDPASLPPSPRILDVQVGEGPPERQARSWGINTEQFSILSHDWLEDKVGREKHENSKRKIHVKDWGSQET